ncbi:MAG TPA: putative lipid II flippase FtsW [Sediminispirochaeta sp.]|nr:putative lipid II flippase FtsW [Sediminispirochaeta sp.]
MSDRFTIERIHREDDDLGLVLLFILLLGIGLVSLFSASYYYGGKRFDEPFYFFTRQLIFVGAGILLAFLVSRVSLDFIRSHLALFLGLTFVLMLATFVPGLKRSVMGANRWLIVGGFSFQPSELTKLALVLYLSSILSKKADRLDDVINSVVPPLIVVIVFSALIYLQNDFSTALFVMLMSLVLFFVAGIKIRYFVLLFLLILPMAAMLIFTKEHRVQRLIAFIDPDSDPIGIGYQVLAAREAIVTGRIWGKGFGQGAEKLGGLPEAHSDFIFAVYAEELGFVGVLFVVGLFFALALKGYAIALRYEQSQDKFGFLLAFGLTSCLVFQAFINIAVASGLLPATGLPLPFFSHGGSSMVVSLVMVGLLLNLGRRRARNGGLYE